MRQGGQGDFRVTVSSSSPVDSSVSPVISGVVLAGVGLLAVVTPFGQEAAQAGFFAFYRFLLLGLGVLCLWQCGDTPGPDFGRGFYRAVSAVLALMLLSIWLGPGWVPAARTDWYGHLLLIFFFVALARFSARQSARWKAKILGVLIASALVHLGLETAGITSVFETFVNRNYLGTYLLIGFSCSTAVVAFNSSLRWRLAGALSAAMLLYGVTGTSSRGATLAAAGVVGVALVKLSKPKVMLLIAGLTVVVIAAGALSSPELIRKFTDRGEIDPYNYDRVGIWASTLEVVAEEPLLGVGLTRFKDRARSFRFPVEETIGRYMMRINIAHSEYLQIAAEAGLPAALLLIGLVLHYLIGLFRSSPDRSDPSLATAEMAAMLVGTGVALHALVDNVWTPPVAVAALSALSLASSRLTVTRAFRFPGTGRAPVYAGIALFALFVSSSLVPAGAYFSHNRALNLSRANEPDAAVAAQRFAVTLWPNDAAMLTNLGIYHQQVADFGGDPQNLDMAAGYYLRAIDANPEYLEAREGYANTILRRLSGDPERDLSIHEQLITTYEDILELDPFLPFITTNLAEAYYWTGQPRVASQLLENAIAMEPNYVDGHLKLAELREAEGDPGTAKRLREVAGAISQKYAARESLTDYERRILSRFGDTGPGLQ